MKKRLVAFFLFLFLAACAGSGTEQIIQPTLTHSIPSATVTRQVKMKPSPVIPTPTVTEKAYLEKKLAPANRNVTFGNENFHSKFSLFVRKNQTISIFDLTTGKTQSGQPVVGNSSLFKINPKNDSIAYMKILPDSLLVTNLTEPPKSIDLPLEASNISWINDYEIAVWGGQRSSCPYLMFIYNTHTHTQAKPTYPLSYIGLATCIFLPSLNETGTQAMFPWTIFNFVTGESKVVPFLQKAPKDTRAFVTQLSNNKLSTVYFDENKLYYVWNLPIEKVNDGVLNEVSLPGFATRSAWGEQPSWSPDKMLIGIDLIMDANIDPIENLVAGKKVPIDYHLIRLDTHEIIDYDLDRQLFEKDPNQDISLGENYFSPDGRYIAWTIYETNQHEPLESKVLDQQSGFIITIPNLEILGWTAAPE